jgi:hypothetical protein
LCCRPRNWLEAAATEPKRSAHYDDKTKLPQGVLSRP